MLIDDLNSQRLNYFKYYIRFSLLLFFNRGINIKKKKKTLYDNILNYHWRDSMNFLGDSKEPFIYIFYVLRDTLFFLPPYLDFCIEFLYHV